MVDQKKGDALKIVNLLKIIYHRLKPMPQLAGGQAKRTGNIGIGTTSPSYKLHVNGSVAGVGAYNDVSDVRYKKNIEDIQNAIDLLLQLRGVRYDWRRNEFKDMNFDQGNQLGLIAQEVERVLPEVVSRDENGYYSLAYSKIIPLLIEAIKDQNSTIEQLKEKNAVNAERIEALESR